MYPFFTHWNENALRLKLYIKYMLSERCKDAVRHELKKMGLHFKMIGLGEVDVMEDLTPSQFKELSLALRQIGLELMQDRRGIMLERIRSAICELIYSDDDLQRCSFTTYLTEKIGGDYQRLAELFSEMQGISIQQYFVTQKVERVKELIVDGELSMTEVAFRMQYSSVGHLSNQFKKVTGHSPSYFRKIRDLRNAADQSCKTINENA
jgi:AraC-like DNA-binding protein